MVEGIRVAVTSLPETLIHHTSLLLLVYSVNGLPVLSTKHLRKDEILLKHIKGLI
jgi:hypothetical protein